MKTNELGAVQGDVPIIKVGSLTLDGKPTQRRIVAYGEATGHHHQLEGKCEVYEVERDLAGQLFKGLEVKVSPDEKVYLTHQEHETIEMTPGLYFIPLEIQQVEYDGENERRVID